MRNGGAKFICINDTPINLVHQSATKFVHVNPGSIDAFALATVDPSFDGLVASKLGVDKSEIETVRRTILDTNGDVIIMLGNDLLATGSSTINLLANGQFTQVGMGKLNLNNSNTLTVTSVNSAGSAVDGRNYLLGIGKTIRFSDTATFGSGAPGDRDVVQPFRERAQRFHSQGTALRRR